MRSVQLKDICKSYNNESFAVEDVSVDIKEGEFFILVGPSGCGKSTMLRMIAGLEDISAGELKIGDKTANHLSPSKRELSMVFQNYALYPHLTVEENILFGLKVKKVSKQERKKCCLEAAEMLGLTDYLKRKPRELSGGQRQRVALARAVVSQAPICLMDEPLSNLDAKLRGQMRSEIRQLQRKLGITMIYVTHDQVEAMTMGDRMMVLKDGKVQQVGTPLDIYNNPANVFVASFIGSPPMNLVKARVDRKEQMIKVEHEQAEIPLNQVMIDYIKGDDILIGVRPEMIESTPSKSMNLKMKTKLVNIEVLGNETLLAFQFGSEVWKAKWLGQYVYQIGEEVSLHVPLDQLYLFDATSGERIVFPSRQVELPKKEAQIL